MTEAVCDSHQPLSTITLGVSRWKWNITQPFLDLFIFRDFEYAIIGGRNAARVTIILFRLHSSAIYSSRAE